MTWYNLTNFTAQNYTGLSTFVTNSSNLITISGQHITGFIIYLMIVISFFAFLKTKGYSPFACYAASTWAGFIIALLMQPIGIIGGVLFIITILLAGFSFILLWFFQSE